MGFLACTTPRARCKCIVVENTFKTEKLPCCTICPTTQIFVVVGRSVRQKEPDDACRAGAECSPEHTRPAKVNLSPPGHQVPVT